MIRVKLKSLLPVDFYFQENSLVSFAGTKKFHELDLEHTTNKQPLTRL